MADLNLHTLRSQLHEGANRTSSLKRLALRLFLIGAFIVLTNFGFSQRVGLLLDTSRYSTLLPFLAIWAIAIAAVVVAAFQPRHWLRMLWAALIAISTAIAWGYHHASQSELNVFDVLSLWNARHEAGRATEFYTSHLLLAATVLAAGFLIIAVPPAPMGALLKRWLSRLALLPLLPVLLIGGIVYAKSGGGSQSLPAQFTPLALTSLATTKIVFQGTPQRETVAWKPAAATSGHIVMLVDESVRADYIDLVPGNPHTPELAALAPRFADFGPAVSGGDCSNYSNALLRFAASRKNLVESVNTSPTLFRYARNAGFRTVFIDAQAGNITNEGLLQNFMTMGEKADIDGYYAIRDVPAEHADERLAEIIAEELKSPQPVFIYANKYGAHFPYDHAYPAEAARYHPAMFEQDRDTQAGRIASYRNAVSWSVDRFMRQLFSMADFSKSTLIYTSDHGQTLDPELLTHCQVDNPDSRMGLVPLLVSASDPKSQEAFAKGAKLLKGKASHFQIAPTLLMLMGYDRKDIAARYDESLLEATIRQPAFTSGDIFGLFSSDIHWNPVDTGADYLEPTAKPLLPVAPQKIAGVQG